VISRQCEFQPMKNLEITLTITLTINLRLTTFCEIDHWWRLSWYALHIDEWGKKYNDVCTR